MERYKEYKDSGVQWIGEIPSHWKQIKMKYCFKERSEKNHPNEPVLCATQSQGVIPQSMYANRVVVVNKGFEGLKLVKEGDFVISLRSFEGGIEYAYYQGIISAAYTVLEPNNPKESDYWKYLFKSQPYIQLLQTCVTGIREGQNINYPLLGRKMIPIPPLDEQKQIVSFIESKTSKIDEYIAEKEKEVQLLNELKEAEIAKVVTQGLNPNVKMKDSGISWIEMIPEHWTIRRIKYIFSELKEKSESGSETPLSLSKDWGIIPFNEKKNKTMESASYIGGKIVHKGEIVFNRFKARLFAVSGYDGIVSSDYAVYKCNKTASPEYMVKLFGTDIYREAFNRKASGIGDGFSRLYTDDLFAMYSVFPPLDEQQAIVAYINEKTAKVESLITDLQAEIEHLKEYKQRLIADCVTGQVNVQNINI